jgi:hypothetical protein
VLLARLGDHRWVGSDEAGALAAFEQAERLLVEQPPSAEHARVLAAHAYALLLSLRSEEARPRCEEAITVARAVGARAEEARGGVAGWPVRWRAASAARCRTASGLRAGMPRPWRVKALRSDGQVVPSWLAAAFTLPSCSASA